MSYMGINDKKDGALRVWHIQNVPNTPKYYDVKNGAEAIRTLDRLAATDLALGDEVQSNAQGLEVFRDGEWQEWENEDGESINEYRDGGELENDWSDLP